MKAQISSIIQAILFASPDPISFEELIASIQKEDETILSEDIKVALIDLKSQFSSSKYGIELQETGMGYSFVSKKEYYPFILKYIEGIQKKRLSRSALETLSIIAFQQHCTKMDIELIRGVSADYAVDKLMERELIEISGRKDTLGHPATYKTTDKFLDYFGLMNIDQLPSIKELDKDENTIGEE